MWLRRLQTRRRRNDMPLVEFVSSPAVIFSRVLIGLSLCGLHFGWIQEIGTTEWKTRTLGKLVQSLRAESASLSKAELSAQIAWLREWQPGKMTAGPKPTSLQAEKKVEPILESSAQSKFRAELRRLDAPEAKAFVEQNVNAPDSDLAVLQACLRWMDTAPARRKQYLDQIEALSVRLIANLRAEIGAVQATGKDNKADELNRALEFALYRRVRALAYRELPTVVAVRPIRNPQRLDQMIKQAFADLKQAAGRNRPEFVLIEVRIHRRNGDFGLALSMLESYGATILPKWYQKKRRDLLKELNWRPAYEEAAGIYQKNFPDEVAKEEAQIRK